MPGGAATYSRSGELNVVRTCMQNQGLHVHQGSLF